MPNNRIPPFFVELRTHPDLSIADQYAMIRDIQGIGIRLSLSQIVSTAKSQLSRYNAHPLFLDFGVLDSQRDTVNLIKYAGSFNTVLTSVNTMADRFVKVAVEEAERQNIKVLGTTISSYYDDAYTNMYFGMNLAGTINFFVARARELGCYGYIVPGIVLAAIKDIRKKVGGIAFCPKVVPSWYSTSGESGPKTVSPAKACENGADIISCHVPIFRGDLEPSEAVNRILSEIRNVTSRARII